MSELDRGQDATRALMRAWFDRSEPMYLEIASEFFGANGANAQLHMERAAELRRFYADMGIVRELIEDLGLQKKKSSDAWTPAEKSAFVALESSGARDESETGPWPKKMSDAGTRGAKRVPFARPSKCYCPEKVT